jgi:hypothetical protein
MPKWVMGVIAAVGIGGLLGAGAWVQRVEDQGEILQSHLKDSCYALCVQRCHRWCEDQEISPEQCGCAMACQRECG